MILSFTDYCNDDCVTDLDMVNESLSISDSAIKESEKVLDFIKNAINNGEVTEVSKTDQGRILRFVDNPVIKVYGCDCELDFTFFEFYGRPSTDDLKGKFGNANTKFHVSDNGGVTTVNFKISYDSVIIVNGSIHEFSRGIIAHELMHAYIDQKIYNNVPVWSAIRTHSRLKKWYNIYSISTKYIDLYQSNIFTRFIDGEYFYEMLFNIYRSDVTEIAAFTQQAYEDCKSCKTLNEIKNKIKKTDLYMIKVALENCLKIMERDDIKEYYNNTKINYGVSNDLPSIYQLTKLFTKRYNKVTSNIGKVITYLDYELDGGKKIGTIVRY